MRLIDADKLKAHYAWWKGGTRELTMDEAKSDFDCIIDLQPTVEPTKHGRWILGKVYEDEYGNGRFNYFCSECGAPAYEFSQPYCHRCGAKMDLDEVGE